MIQYVKNWRDAASLILVARNGANSFKLLMLRRNENAKFMPGSLVFPGGVTSPVDFHTHWNDSLSQPIPVNQTRPLTYLSNDREGVHPEVALRVCALRETFEESGVLLSKRNKRCIALTDPDQHVGGEHSTLGRWRDEVQRNPDAFLDLFRTTDLTPSINSLVEWSTWLTPSTYVRRRFDTMFYTCFLDDIVMLNSADKTEVVEANWHDAQDLIAEHSCDLPAPQYYEINRLVNFNGFDGLNDFALSREKSGLKRWCPYFYHLKDGTVVCYPGDDAYEEDPNKQLTKLDNVTVEQFRKQSKQLNRTEETSDGLVTIVCNVAWCGHPPVKNAPSVTYNSYRRL